MEHVTLRDATPDDLDFLVSLARAAYQEVLARQFSGWDDAVHARRFAEKVRTLPFRVVEIHGEPVATISVSVHDDHLRIEELVILPAFQNRGLGTFLLQREIERARSLALPLRLHTLRLNRALAFYERHGFVVTGSRKEKFDLERCG